jgi:hypothetical protein
MSMMESSLGGEGQKEKLLKKEIGPGLVSKEVRGKSGEGVTTVRP